MPKSVARRSRHEVLPEDPPLTAPDISESLRIAPVADSKPQPGAVSPIEPHLESAASIGAATSERSNVKATSESGHMPYVNLNGPQSSSGTQPACPPETVPNAPVPAVPPSSSGAATRAAAEAWIEQEKTEFRIAAKSVEAEISRLQNLTAEQEGILASAEEKRDKNIEKARGIIEGKKEKLLEASELITPAASFHDTLAMKLAPIIPPAGPISSIPSELLISIFAMADMTTPLLLVCKQWHSIILSNGHFWNNIVLTTRPDGINPCVYGYEPWQPRPQLCRSLFAVEQALKRSKSAPLSVTIDLIDFHGDSLDRDEFGETSFNTGPERVERRRDAVKLVETELPRIRILSVFAIGGIKGDAKGDAFDPDRAMILEKLHLTERMYDSSIDDMRFSQLICAANLRTLRFLNYPTDHLEHLTHVNWSGFVDISIEGLFVDWGALDTPVTLPNLRILRLGGRSLDTLRKLQTPCLESLVICDPKYRLEPDRSRFDSVHVLSVTALHLWHDFSILEMLSIPTSTHIDLQPGLANEKGISNKPITTIFKEAESRFPNLTSLVLCTYKGAGSVSKGLEHLPHLVDLCVDDRYRKLAPAFWKDFTRTMKGRGRTKTPKILPNLKRLLVRLDYGLIPEIEALATKAKVAREVAGRPLTLLVVEWKLGEASNIVGERRKDISAVTFPRRSV